MNNSAQVRSEAPLLRAWISSLRPAHWIKNALVGAPAVFGHASLTPSLAMSLVAAFFACSMAASAGYLVNDVLDRGSDSLHARKRLRPVALGVIEPKLAVRVATALALAAVLLAYAMSPIAATLVAFYIALTVVYSRWLKRLPVVDVCVLALLFVLRLFVGGIATNIAVSGWLLGFGCSLFLSLALAKRLDEVVTSGRAAGESVPGRAYGPDDIAVLTSGMLICALTAIGVLIAYMLLPAGDLYLYRQPEWLWLSTAVLALWLWYMLRRAATGQLHGDPVVIAASDPVSLVLAAAVTVTLILAV